MLTAESWQGVIEFITVVKQGNFTAAAKALEVSVSHVSRQIEKLEQRLGARLFQRSTRKMRLTEAGEEYFRACEPLVNGLEQANYTLSESAETPKGHIRISSGGAWVAQVVSPVLTEFLSLHPEVSIHLDFTSREVDLIKEGYDLAIRFGKLADSSLTARKLASRRLVVCGAPDYLKRAGAPQHPNQLDRFQCLAGHTDHWRFQWDGQSLLVRANGRFRCGNPIALASAAQRGLGLIYVPYFYVADHLKSGQLVSVLEPYVAQDKASWLIYPSHDYLPQATRMLIQHILTRLEADE